MPSNPSKTAPEQIILGIDPGTTIMGYGVIRVRGKQVELVEMGALHLTKYKDHAVKLKRIFDRCAALIETHAPDHLAVSNPMLIGSPAASAHRSHGRLGCHSASNAAASDQMLWSVNAQAI